MLPATQATVQLPMHRPVDRPDPGPARRHPTGRHGAEAGRGTMGGIIHFAFTTYDISTSTEDGCAPLCRAITHTARWSYGFRWSEVYGVELRLKWRARTVRGDEGQWDE